MLRTSSTFRSSPHNTDALLSQPPTPTRRQRCQLINGIGCCLVSVISALFTGFVLGHLFLTSAVRWPSIPHISKIHVENTRGMFTRDVYQAAVAGNANFEEVGGIMTDMTLVVEWAGVKSFSLKRGVPARVTVQYKTTGGKPAGLFNQHIAHEHAFMLAVGLQAEEVMWPPSREKDTVTARNDTHWHTVPASKLYDMPNIQEFAKKQYNITVTPVSSKSFKHQFVQPRLDSDAGGYVTLLDSVGNLVPGKNVLLKKNIREGYNDLRTLTKDVNEKILDLLEDNKDYVEGIPEVAVVLESTYFMLKTVPKNIAVPVMSHLLFAKNLRDLAETAADAAKERSILKTYNGLHLRVEQDAAAFADRVGGECGVRVLHNKAMHAAGFNAHEPVFAASGIFSLSEISPSNLDKIITYSSELLCNKHASKVLTKEMLLAPQRLAGLGAEERAVIDWLILKEARLAVGWAASTFSMSLQQRRIIDGAPEATTRLVHFDWDAQKRKAKIGVPQECKSSKDVKQ